MKSLACSQYHYLKAQTVFKNCKQDRYINITKHKKYKLAYQHIFLSSYVRTKWSLFLNYTKRVDQIIAIGLNCRLGALLSVELMAFYSLKCQTQGQHLVKLNHLIYKGAFLRHLVSGFGVKYILRNVKFLELGVAGWGYFLWLSGWLLLLHYQSRPQRCLDRWFWTRWKLHFIGVFGRWETAIVCVTSGRMKTRVLLIISPDCMKRSTSLTNKWTSFTDVFTFIFIYKKQPGTYKFRYEQLIVNQPQMILCNPINNM